MRSKLAVFISLWRNFGRKGSVNCVADVPLHMH